MYGAPRGYEPLRVEIWKYLATRRGERWPADPWPDSRTRDARAGAPSVQDSRPLHLRTLRSVLFCVSQCGGRNSAAPEVVEHEQPDHRRQITLRAKRRDFLHAVSESLFEADAGLVTRNHDRTSDDGRLHEASPPSMRF